MSNNQVNNDLKTQLWGWGLFTLSGVLFAFTGLRAGDILTTIASLTFLIGCVVFVMPLLKAIIRD